KLHALGLTVFSAGIVGMCWSSRFHLGMYDNVLMPLHALSGLAVALTLAQATGPGRRDDALEWTALIFSAAFIWRLEFPLEREVPSKVHLEQYEKLVSDLKKLPPETWVAFHGVPSHDAGLKPRSHWMGM